MGKPAGWHKDHDRGEPLTEEQLQGLRKSIGDLASKTLDPVGDTCDYCSRRYWCRYVWDPYNTNGDCLRDK